MTTVTAAERPVSLSSTERRIDNPVYQAFTLLRIGFTVAPILFGLDKFLDWLVDWRIYLAPEFNDLIPGNAHQALLAIGVVEIVAGLVVALAPASAGTWSPLGWAGSSPTCSCKRTITTSRCATSGSCSRR